MRFTGFTRVFIVPLFNDHRLLPFGDFSKSDRMQESFLGPGLSGHLFPQPKYLKIHPWHAYRIPFAGHSLNFL